MSSLQSMTGFGKAELSHTDGLQLCIEIKSVNNRFKDFRFKLPAAFNRIELELRKEIDSLFSRGSFDISLNIKKIKGRAQTVCLDWEKIKEVIKSFNDLAQANSNKNQFTYSPSDFLRSEFFLDQSDDESEQLCQLAIQTMTMATQELKQSRLEEGKKLKECITQHKIEYTNLYESVIHYAKSYEKDIRENLLKKFKEHFSEANTSSERFLQEVIFYLEKLDITEEINRIKAHLEKLDDLLEQKTAIGRGLDFLLQELNRETNTIGSKSGHIAISEAVVQMKIQLEKIREQALNIE